MTGPARDASAESGGSPLDQEIHDVEILGQAASAAGWSAEYRQLGAGKLTVRSVGIQCAGILVVSQQSDRSLEVVGEPPAGMLTAMIPAPGDDFWVNGYSVQDKEFIVLSPGAEMYAVTRSAVAICAVHIPDSLMDLGGSHLEFHQESRERGRVISSPARMGAFDSLRRIVKSTDLLQSREAELASFLTGELVPLIRESCKVAPATGQHDRAHRWKVLRRARVYIENHLGGAIQMAELCNHAGASSRTVERVFQQELQMTPIAYIRVRRLNAVKRELVNRGGADKTVTEIAMHHGFGHLGRFSAAYRKHFGHSPSEALRRAGLAPDGRIQS